MSKLPKGVRFQKKTLATGEVIRYGYLGRGPGAVALGRADMPEFYTNLALALSNQPTPGAVSYLIWRYKTSAEFAKLRPRTQSDYRRHLDRIQTTFGRLPVSAIQLPQMSDRIFGWRDRLAKSSPRQADYAVSVLSAMLAWSCVRGLTTHNRAAGVGDVYTANRREKVWSDADEASMLKTAPPTIRLAVILALETGLAQEDLLVLPWSAVRGNVIVTRRLKNGTAVAIPVSPKLRAALDAAPRTAETVLTKNDGTAWEPKANGFRARFGEARTKAGVDGLTFHDMRGTYITRRRAMGWTAEETALTSGHKVVGEQGAQSSYVDRESVAVQNATRLWARFYGPKTERSRQTARQTDARSVAAK